MRTYKLTIAYDGSRFRGWQRQPDTELTIQGILERDISEYVGYKVEVNGSGRTDGGAHASGQTASIILSGKVDEPVFLTEINEKNSGGHPYCEYGTCKEWVSCTSQCKR